jgi:hypothetical protein
MRPGPGTAWRRLTVARRFRHAGALIQAARVVDPVELEREMSGVRGQSRRVLRRKPTTGHAERPAGSGKMDPAGRLRTC